MPTIEQLQSELERYRELYAKADRDGNASGKEGARQKIVEIEAQILALQQEQREQRQAEHVDGLLESVRNLRLFEAVDPEPENGERLHEYDERRKEFNLILYDFVREQIQKVNEEHNAEIEEKDKRIRALNDQSLRDRKELDEAKETIQRLNEKIQQLTAQVEQQEETIKQKDGELRRLQERIRELEQAQKPAEYTPPSESLTERVNSLKAKSSSLNKTVEERLAAFYERNKHVLQLPDFTKKEEQPVGESFRTESQNDPAAESGNSGIPAAKTAEVGFRDVPNVQPAEGRDATDESVEGSKVAGMAYVTRDEFEALKRRVDHLYRVSGHSEPAA